MDILKQLAEELHLEPRRVESVVALLDDGNTIPFIARYRKEQTGAMDDQVLRSLSERLDYLRRLQEQKEKIRASLEEQEVLNEELSESLGRAVTLAELEDLYRPYRPSAALALPRRRKGDCSLWRIHCMPSRPPVRRRRSWPRRTGIRKRGWSRRKPPFREPGIFWQSGLRTTPPAGQGCGPFWPPPVN